MVVDIYDHDTPNDHDQAAMAEIAENLHRRELGEIEKAELLAKWVQIISRKADQVSTSDIEKVSGEVRPKQKVGRPSGGINRASRAIGIPPTNLKQAVRIAGLSPEAKDAGRRTSAPQAVLLEAAKEETPEGP